VQDCSTRGGIVLDTSVGSGTALLAAEKTGRVGRAIELDPHYVDAAIGRWQALTGNPKGRPRATEAHKPVARIIRRSLSEEIYRRHLELGCVLSLAMKLCGNGIVSKVTVSRLGHLPPTWGSRPCRSASKIRCSIRRTRAIA
jgi:hypothetical protein